MTGLHVPELAELSTLFGPEAGETLARAPGGWRTLSAVELDRLEILPGQQESVLALQRLLRHEYPCLGLGALASADAVGRAYQDWFGSLDHEVVVALVLDGRNCLLQELEVSRGGLHGAALTPRDVFQPVIRAGASALILAHNHPSGDPTPSVADVVMTRAVAAAGEIVAVPLLDHLIFGARGGGYVSLFDLGLMPAPEPHRNNGAHHEEGSSLQAVPA